MAPLLLSGQPLPSSPVFEAASIKPSPPGEQSVISRLPGGRFTAEKTTLKALVKWTYELTDDELPGGPAWTDSDRYDIVATPDHNVGNEQVTRDEQIKMMLRSLLAERFKLAMHQEPRSMSAYILSVGKNGPKMDTTTHPPGPRHTIRRRGPLRILIFQAAPTPYIARFLSAQLKRKVVDETNLEGAFDAKLEWALDIDRAGPPGDAPAPPAGPSIFTAVQQQLGLNLRAAKVSVPVYVIDSVEKPSDN